MTDVIAIMNAIEADDLVEFTVAHCADALVEELIREKPALKDTRDIMLLADAYAGENGKDLVGHVVDNYSDQLKEHAVRILEDDEQIAFSIADLRKALWFGELETVIRNELVKLGVPPWG